MATYACADIHGVYPPFRKMMNFLKPDDKLYFIGDACDRGPDGIKIFNELINDSRVTYLIGNHEQMMYNAIPYVIKSINEFGYINDNDFEISVWFSNGGDKTANAFLDMNMSINEIHEIREKIKNMPTKLEYQSPLGHKVILEHAGYSPFIVPPRAHDPVWDRDHFHDEWFGTWGDFGVDPEKTYLVHGHTPVQYLKYYYGYTSQPQLTKEELKQKREWESWKNSFDWKPEVIRYCYGHKFDIDMCTIVSNRIALLNLDTFEVKYFDD